MRKLAAIAVLLLAAGCAKQNAYDAWQVPSSGIPEYDIAVVGEDTPGALFSAQITDPGWSEQEVKQIAANVIERRRDTYSAIVVRFVGDAGMRTAAFAKDSGGAQHLRSAGFDPADVESQGFPFLGFLRAENPPEPAGDGSAEEQLEEDPEQVPAG